MAQFKPESGSPHMNLPISEMTLFHAKVNLFRFKYASGVTKNGRGANTLEQTDQRNIDEGPGAVT